MPTTAVAARAAIARRKSERAISMPATVEDVATSALVRPVWNASLCSSLRHVVADLDHRADDVGARTCRSRGGQEDPERAARTRRTLDDVQRAAVQHGTELLPERSLP